RLMRDPFASYFKQQEQILNAFTVPNQITESVRLATDMFREPFQQLDKQFASMFTPQSTVISDSLAQYAATAEPFQKIANQWNDSVFLAFQEALANNSYQQQLNSIQKSLASFSTAFESISIHNNYVDMPEVLIPDDFSYEEIKAGSCEDFSKKLEAAPVVKRLSFTDALAILVALIQLVCWIITFIQAQQSSFQMQQNHEELVYIQDKNNQLQEEANILQEEANFLQIEQNQLLQQQLDCAEEQRNYLIAIYNKIQESDSPLPSNDSDSPNTDLCSPDDSLESQLAESKHSTIIVDSADTDILQQTD
ncbi:MAG: hypothetical protein RSC33_07210, partial [Vagococcus sp.]